MSTVIAGLLQEISVFGLLKRDERIFRLCKMKTGAVGLDEPTTPVRDYYCEF